MGRFATGGFHDCLILGQAVFGFLGAEPLAGGCFAGHRRGARGDDVLLPVVENDLSDVADFRDITTGNNNQPEVGVEGFPAVAGWDPVTGFGSPIADKLLPDLVAATS